MSRSRVPIFEDVAVKRVLKTTTSGSGATFVQVGNAAGGPLVCRTLTVMNLTVAQLSFGVGVADPDGVNGYLPPAGETFEIPVNGSFVFDGLSSSAELFVKRTDESGTQVTFKAWARN